ncbi:alpha/beta hydrolase [Actinokineospora sp. 24-640]
MLSRRSLLLTGAAAVAGTAAAIATGTLPQAALFARTIGAAGQRVPKPVVRTERLRSAARGREVAMVTILPTELPTKNLPVCLFLHGRRGDAATAFPGRLAEHLVSLVAHEAIPPFAFVSVDGGDNYWHESTPGDDPMAMLLDEVPRWLAARHLGAPFACAGISMGGFGALVYARRRCERKAPLRAVATIAPALITNWPEMDKRGIFAGEREWAALDPLRHIPALERTPVGIWCGTEDMFIDGARLFIEQANPAVAYTGPGEHGGGFFDRVVPDVLTWLGDQV